MLLAPTARGDVVHGVDARAIALGIAPGQRATDVMAAHRDLRAAYADPGVEAAALERLAAWMRRWSPLARADGTDGVALDATGCAHLFGGEAAMLESIGARLAGLGVTARLAIAPNRAAAHALARHAAGSGTPAIVAGAGLEAALAPLPVAALRIDPASALVLRRLGLKTVGQLAAIPRPALKRRFRSAKRRDPRDETWDDYLGRATGASADVLRRLDEALGTVSVPLDPGREEVPPRIAKGLPEPVMETDTVLACARPLLDDLAAVLEGRGEGARALLFEAFRVDGGRSEAVLSLSRATRDAGHLVRLLAERLDGWHAEFGYDALAVEAMRTEPIAPTQADAEAPAAAVDPHALIDRLRARLGREAVLRPTPLASHWPSRAEDWLPAGEGRREGVGANAMRMGRVKTLAPGGANGPVAWTDAGPTAWADAGAPAAPRPERLFEPPEEIAVVYALPEGPPARFTWRRVTHRVARVAGPERVAPEWWREPGRARARDYFRVETGEGQRLWLFREGFEGDERPGRPRWFCHGAFS